MVMAVKRCLCFSGHIYIDMFYRFNHLIYREVDCGDLRNKVLYPEIVKELSKIFHLVK